MDKQIKIGVLIIRNESALLIKEWSNKRKDYFWNFIKGTFEDDLDKTITDCAVREAVEEAGVTVKLENFINCSVKYENKITTYLNFSASIIEGEPILDSTSNQKSRGEDIKAIRWFSKEEIRNINENEFISNIVYAAINDWLEGKQSSLTTFKEFLPDSISI